MEISFEEPLDGFDLFAYLAPKHTSSDLCLAARNICSSRRAEHAGFPLVSAGAHMSSEYQPMLEVLLSECTSIPRSYGIAMGAWCVGRQARWVWPHISFLTPPQFLVDTVWHYPHPHSDFLSFREITFEFERAVSYCTTASKPRTPSWAHTPGCDHQPGREKTTLTNTLAGLSLGLGGGDKLFI